MAPTVGFGAAQAAAMRWRYLKDDAGAALLQSLREFLDEGKLILGICNGFQLLVKLGVLPSLGGQRFERQVSLGNNDSARFEDRWVHLLPNAASPCVFTKNLPLLSMPVRHGEIPPAPSMMHLLTRNGGSSSAVLREWLFVENEV